FLSHHLFTTSIHTLSLHDALPIFPSVIETDRTDRQFVTQAAAERITHVVHTGFFRSGKQVAGVKKECALKLTVNRKRVLDIENRSEEHTSEFQSLRHLVCRLLLEK